MHRTISKMEITHHDHDKFVIQFGSTTRQIVSSLLALAGIGIGAKMIRDESKSERRTALSVILANSACVAMMVACGIYTGRTNRWTFDRKKRVLIKTTRYPFRKSFSGTVMEIPFNDIESIGVHTTNILTIPPQTIQSVDILIKSSKIHVPFDVFGRITSLFFIPLISRAERAQQVAKQLDIIFHVFASCQCPNSTQRDRIGKMFKQVDTDCSGTLDKREFDARLGNHAKISIMLMKLFDIDQDSGISPHEFEAFVLWFWRSRFSDLSLDHTIGVLEEKFLTMVPPIEEAVV
jgi:hypothetical protein